MKSHRCDFQLRHLLPVIAPPAGVAALIAGLLHLLHAVHWLPSPWPGQDMDRTILFHKAELTRSRINADLLLLGDSSCLMGVDAIRLEEQMPGSPVVLNLATLSYLTLPDHAKLAARYLENHPESRPLALLLMHPEALRSSMPSTYHQSLLDHYLEGKLLAPPDSSRILQWMGVPLFQTRLAVPLLPPPLPAEFGVQYGFTTGLRQHLQQHRGSAVDPRRFNPERVNASGEYRLLNSIEPLSKEFRFRLPESVRVAVGIMPVPEELAWEHHAQKMSAMLKEWGQWLKADYLLEDLPAVLPDEMFASRTHLNAEGQEYYSTLLAHRLQELIQKQRSRK